MFTQLTTFLGFGPVAGPDASSEQHAGKRADFAAIFAHTGESGDSMEERATKGAPPPDAVETAEDESATRPEPDPTVNETERTRGLPDMETTLFAPVGRQGPRASAPVAKAEPMGAEHSAVPAAHGPALTSRPEVPPHLSQFGPDPAEQEPLIAAGQQDAPQSMAAPRKKVDIGAEGTGTAEMPDRRASAFPPSAAGAEPGAREGAGIMLEYPPSLARPKAPPALSAVLHAGAEPIRLKAWRSNIPGQETPFKGSAIPIRPDGTSSAAVPVRETAAGPTRQASSTTTAPAEGTPVVAEIPAIWGEMAPKHDGPHDFPDIPPRGSVAGVELGLARARGDAGAPQDRAEPSAASPMSGRDDVKALQRDLVRVQDGAKDGAPVFGQSTDGSRPLSEAIRAAPPGRGAGETGHPGNAGRPALMQARDALARDASNQVHPAGHRAVPLQWDVVPERAQANADKASTSAAIQPSEPGTPERTERTIPTHSREFIASAHSVNARMEAAVTTQSQRPNPGGYDRLGFLRGEERHKGETGPVRRAGTEAVDGPPPDARLLSKGRHVTDSTAPLMHRSGSDGKADRYIAQETDDPRRGLGAADRGIDPAAVIGGAPLRRKTGTVGPALPQSGIAKSVPLLAGRVTAPGIEEAGTETGTESAILPQASEARSGPAPLPSGLAAVARHAPANDVLRQVAEALTEIRGGRVEIRLSPEELGMVRMTLAQGEGGLAVHIQAERSETLDLMRRNVDQLARDLAQSGHGGASFTFGDGQSRTQQTQRTRPGIAHGEDQETEMQTVRTSPSPSGIPDGLDLLL